MNWRCPATMPITVSFKFHQIFAPQIDVKATKLNKRTQKKKKLRNLSRFASFDRGI